MDGHGIKHIGIKRRSGRYPWGSGENAFQREKDFLGTVEDLKLKGLSESEIATGFGLNTRELREKRSIALAEKKAAERIIVLNLKEKGYSNVAIGKRLGRNESYVRFLLDEAAAERSQKAAVVADILKNAVDKKELIDIGVGSEQHLGISRTKLNTAVAMLEEKGYNVYTLEERQVGTGKYTKIKVLAPPGMTFSEVSKNRSKISMVDEYSHDGGDTFQKTGPPKSVDSSRILIKYKEEGGSDKDGVIELRRGVDDISLGNVNYAQVRIAVDGKRFMKGMAMYSDNIPDGYDIIYNTNKKKGTPPEDVYKKFEDDPDNPFGSTVRQKEYIDSKGQRQQSAINTINEEGDWETWSKTLSSQVLSKQTPALVKKQLQLTLSDKMDEFDEIMSLTNPSVKKALLTTFADEADSAAAHLKAAPMVRQHSQVLLPFTSIKENEIYAPNFRDGEPVVLIRHPHGGIFEIPTLKVNNKNPEAKRIIGKAIDGVGINPKVASILSGADFDGDSVIVIPNRHKLIQTSKPLAALKDFDPREVYKGYEGMKVIKPKTKQMEMGKVSNLITDMTIKGASHDEIARAIRHSMVVIDAEKHKLNYKQSYLDHGIAALKEKYQGSSTAGASTLISKASSIIRVPERKEGIYIINPKTGKRKRIYVDPDTGEKLYTETGRTYLGRRKLRDPDTGKVLRDPVTGKIQYELTGKIEKATTKITRMEKEKDAYKLSSGSVIENLYADYANSLKGIANKARRIVLSTKDIPYSASARITFDKEVRTLRDKLALAYRNKPLERKAQLMANKIISAKIRDNPDIDPDDLKKLKSRALEEARARYGAKKVPVEITDREWQAIQAGAISPSALSKILLNTDLKYVKMKSLPKSTPLISPAKAVRIRTMIELGHTRAEVADALGISISTLDKVLKEGD